MANSKSKSPAKKKIPAKINTDWQQIARLALTSRNIDLIEEQELAPSGKIKYQFSSRGHELAQVLLGSKLTHPKDGATVYYRSRPFMIAVGLTPKEIFAAGMAKVGSPTEGRDVGVMYALPPRNGPTVLPASGAVGAQYTPAAGWAQAIRYYREELKDKSYDGAIAVTLGGDGSVAANGFWAALTIATTQNLPMLFSIEDNGYGISVPKYFQTPGGDITENLASFKNLKIFSGSGIDPIECDQLTQAAVDYVRAGKGPALLRLDVPRLTGHTFGEDQSAYKSQVLLNQEKSNDPVLKLKEFIDDDKAWDALDKEIQSELTAALAEAETHADPPSGSAPLHLFHGSDPLVPPSFDAPALNFSIPAIEDGPRINFSEAVRRTLDNELEQNSKLLVFGEDVGPRGGVHRVTLDLQSKYGERRVFDTSLSEEGIMGRAAGLAFAGLRPVPEIQFRKYADPAMEQINDIGWMRWRMAGKFEAPVIVRIPVGHSKKVGDPWHSVSAEAVYAHSLGWRIAMPSNAADAVGLLRAALRGHDPTIFLEHRALLDTPVSRRPYPGDDYAIEFGQANIVQTGNALTIVTWGEMLHRCLEAAQSFGDQIEIIDLRTISPWDKDTVVSSLRKTGKCLIAHEDTRTVGFGAEISATLTEACFASLDAPIKRLTTKDLPIPYNPSLMAEVIPTVADLAAEMENLLSW